MNDEEIMLECISHASTYAGFTKSNPKVGSALVDKGGNILTIDAHTEYGGKHAEVNLFERANSQLPSLDYSDKRLFVTLEPCSTFGKTPPCVDKIISSGIKEVVISVLDPNKRNNFGGVKKLIDAGVSVKLGVAVEQGANLIEDFIKSQSSEYPYTSAKVAMSIDGLTATRSYDSRWITSEESRIAVHALRSEADAIVTGIGTVAYDDPMLNCRLYESTRQPTRIILDSALKISRQSKILKSAKEIDTIIFVANDIAEDRVKSVTEFGAKVILTESSANGFLDIKDVMKQIKKLGMINVMVEAGSTLLGSLHDNDLIDRYLIFIAPMIIGGKEGKNAIGGLGFEKIDMVQKFKDYRVSRCGVDIFVNARQHDYKSEIIKQTLAVRDELCLQG